MEIAQVTRFQKSWNAEQNVNESECNNQQIV